MAGSPIESSASAPEEPGQFTLQILSPSLNVPQPLFLTIPITTTVQQLKERIRSHVTTKPPDDAQRLIHRGRLLARESETMVELFGEEPLRTADHQTLHLVLRDLSDGQTPNPRPVSSQHASSRSQSPGHQLPQQPQHHARSYVRLGPHPNLAYGNPQAPGALNGTQLPPGMTVQHLLQNQLQGNLGLQAQNQNPLLSSMNQHGIQNRGGPGTTTPGRTGSPFGPETTRTVVREGVGPDGQRWRVIVNESIITTAHRPGSTGPPAPSAETPVPPNPQPRATPFTGSLGGYDSQYNFRPPDMDSATRAMVDAMRRNASSSSLANLASYQNQQPIPPGVTTPLVPSRNGSTAGTPDPLRATGRATNASAGTSTSQASLATPEVYILSSPDGPRAVLLNGTLGTYSSSQLRSYQPVGAPPAPMPFHIVSAIAPHPGQDPPPRIIPRSSIANRNTSNTNPNNPPPAQQPQLQPQNVLQVPDPLQAHLGHGMANPQVHAIRIVQIWPHIWMIIRLALFIWWFTSPTSSWSRWITVISIAIALFIVNTGAFNPLAEQIWVPLRRHLENLIPLAADGEGRNQQHAAAENAQAGDANDMDPARPQNPNPADAAARLVQRRRQDNANWLLNQARRLERAGILFIASLAPGLAERHIAQVEAEARADRQRQQEAEAAAAATSAALADDVDGNSTTDRPEAGETLSNDNSPNYEAESSNSALRQDASAQESGSA
ncbi:hypothetical protein F4802DRAFT_447708 [Xylaria palmicola]|nr:hypothetical protein F4802DRAFT_447708 [Xylaria palmicola]